MSGATFDDVLSTVESFMGEKRDDPTSTRPGDVRSGTETGNHPHPLVTHFEHGDAENPNNFSTTKKSWIVVLGIVLTLNSTLGSTMPSGSIGFIAESFDIKNEQQLTLPTSVFLVGYIVGPLFLAPLSEVYGRRPILLSTHFLFICFTLGTALISTFYGLLIFRLLAGTVASAPLSFVASVYADILSNPIHRGRVVALFAAGTTLGPTTAPFISGFLGTISWRWPFRAQVIFAGLTMIPLLFLPETFTPVILARRASRLRKEQGRDDIFSPVEMENIALKRVFAITLTRPIGMFFTEPIVTYASLYQAFVYSMLYLFFQAYPVIFQGVYGMAPGISGLAFLPIGVGAFISVALVIAWDDRARRRQVRNAEFVLTPEYRRLWLACVGGPLVVISLFWLGWTSRVSIHYMVPIFAGLPFGIGASTIIVAMLNYLADAYGIYSAAPMATAACTRSISGALLPLAAKPMYRHLGIAWASSLLGFVGLVMILIPIIFMRYGAEIRASSPFCKVLAERRTEGSDEVGE